MILDLFAGPGGWSEGLRLLGLSDVGIEWDAAACRTRAAAGHPTVRADVATYPKGPFVGKVTGLIASPPCQDFSLAGRQAGRSGVTGRLIDSVPEWVAELQPDWLACEQVPPAMPVWREHAEVYRSWGYSVWVGKLNAADYGVPQTRKRAFLIASRVGVASAPEPTHAADPVPSLLASPDGWVTMTDALPDRTDLPDWCHTRPATTLVSSFRPDVVAGPGWRKAGDGPRQNAPGSVNITEREALVLQSFPADYPVQGSKSKRFEQIGNAVPPRLAAAVVSQLTGRPVSSVATGSW